MGLDVCMGWRGSVGLPVMGVAIVFATAGCSGDDSTSGFPTSGVFQSTSDSTFPLVAGTSVRMEVTEGRLSVTAGCNTLMGSYSVADDVLSVPVLASTRIGCPDDLAEQDQRLEQLLTSSPNVVGNPVGFTLTGSDSATLEMTQISSSPTTS